MRRASYIQTFIHCPPWHGHASSLYCLWSLTRAQLKEGGRDHCLLNMMGSATTNRSLSCPFRRGVLYYGQGFCRRFLKKSLRLLVEFNVSLDNLLSVTLAPQNAALSSRNVGTDTVDRTVATHHCNIYHFRRINLSGPAFIALCSRLVLPSTFCSTAVVAAVGEGIYFGFYKTNALKKTAHKT